MNEVLPARSSRAQRRKMLRYIYSTISVLVFAVCAASFYMAYISYCLIDKQKEMQGHLAHTPAFKEIMFVQTLFFVLVAVVSLGVGLQLAKGKK